MAETADPIIQSPPMPRDSTRIDGKADELVERRIGQTIDNRIHLAKLESSDEYCHTYIGWSLKGEVYFLYRVMIFSIIDTSETKRNRTRDRCKRLKRKKSCIKVLREGETETEFLIMAPRQASSFVSDKRVYLRDNEQELTIEIPQSSRDAIPLRTGSGGLSRTCEVPNNTSEFPQNQFSLNPWAPEFESSLVTHQLQRATCGCRTTWPPQPQVCTLYSEEQPPNASFRIMCLMPRCCRRCRYPCDPLDGKSSPKCKLPLRCEYPPESDDPLRCEMRWVSTEQRKRHSARFSALSYCWGDVTDKRPITVNGHTIGITKNLYEALMSLRQPNKAVNLWVDAICINQNDDAEKSWQVEQIPEIYQAAERVIAWLGPSSPATGLAFKYVADRLKINRDLLSKPKIAISLIEDILATLELLSKWDYWTKARKKAQSTEVLIAEIEKGLESLWSLPYWSRVWVVQELAAVQKAGHKRTLRLGDHGIPFSSFVDFMGIVRTKVAAAGQQAVTTACNRLIRLSSPATSMDFLETLWESAHLQSSNPLDRIYGIRYILPDFYREKLGVDYTMTFPDLYHKVITQHVEHDRSLDMLACFRQLALASDTSVGLPSWLPDLRSRHTGLLPFTYNCAAGRPSRARVEGGILRAWGFRIGGVVENVRGPYRLERHKGTTIEHALGGIEDMILPIWAVEERGGYSQGYRSRFWNMVSGNMLYSMENDSSYTVRCRLEVVDDGSVLVSVEDGQRFGDMEDAKCRVLMPRLQDRCAFTTRDGRVGLGPGTMQKNDIVVILDGCRLCIVLRLLGAAGFYSFVGPAYVDGVMGGEYLLRDEGATMRSVEFAIV